MRRVMHLVRKEFLELRQEPRLFAIVIVAPLLQLTMLGYAASTDVRNVPIVVVDEDASPASRDLIARFEASQYFIVVDALSSATAVDAYLDGGRAWMALTIPADYGNRVASGQSAVVQVIADGTDGNSTNVALGYARLLVASYARDLQATTTHSAATPLIRA